MNHKPRTTPLILTLAAALLACGTLELPSRAATRLTEDFTELLKLADAVAEVRVEQVAAPRENGAGMAMTLATLKVLRVYKGGLAANSEVTAEYFGGYEGQQQVVCSGQPRMKAGDHLLVLLAEPRTTNHEPRTMNHWRVLGGDAGQIILSRDDNGHAIAFRANGRFEYYVRDASSLTGYRSVNSPAVSAGHLDELLHAVLDTGRPVIETPANHEPTTTNHEPILASHEAPTSIHQPPSTSPFLAMFVLAIAALSLVVVRRGLRLRRD